MLRRSAATECGRNELISSEWAFVISKYAESLTTVIFCLYAKDKRQLTLCAQLTGRSLFTTETGMPHYVRLYPELSIQAGRYRSPHSSVSKKNSQG